MKHVWMLLLVIAAFHVEAQGLFKFSGGPAILLHGKPAKKGEATVQLATKDNQLIGLIAPISIFDGQIAPGWQIITGMTGTVRLRLAVKYTAYPDVTVFSDLFSYTLGKLPDEDDLHPPSPSGIPLRDPINFAPPAFQTLGMFNNVSIKQVNPVFPAKFYRAHKLKIISKEEDTILLNYEGQLEIAPTPHGPWKLLD